MQLGAFPVDPIPALDGILLAVRMSKLAGDATAQLTEQKRQTPRGAPPQAWIALYEAAIQLAGQAVQAQLRMDRERAQRQSAAAEQRRLSSLANEAVQALQQEKMEWQTRLAQQEAQLAEKAERSVEQIECAERFDAAHGTLVFELDPASRQAFMAWLVDTERKWAMNNASLAPVRAKEAIERTTGAQGGFDVAAADPQSLLSDAAPQLNVEGKSLPRPTTFAVLGTGYRAVMTTLGAVSMLGVVVGRIWTAASLVLPIVSGATLVVVIVVAIVTVPKQHAQAMTRLRGAAKKEVRAQAVQRVRARLSRTAADQLRGLRKHLDGEAARIRVAARGSPDSGPEMAFSAGGISPAEMSRLQGEYVEALRKRIAELRGA